MGESDTSAQKIKLKLKGADKIAQPLDLLVHGEGYFAQNLLSIGFFAGSPGSDVQMVNFRSSSAKIINGFVGIHWQFAVL